MVEWLLCKQHVAGSNPAISTNRRRCGSLKHFVSLFCGDIAQLVERLNGIEKVRGSTPLISTINVRVQIKGFPRFLVCAAIRPE